MHLMNQCLQLFCCHYLYSVRFAVTVVSLLCAVKIGCHSLSKLYSDFVVNLLHILFLYLLTLSLNWVLFTAGLIKNTQSEVKLVYYIVLCFGVQSHTYTCQIAYIAEWRCDAIKNLF